MPSLDGSIRHTGHGKTPASVRGGLNSGPFRLLESANPATGLEAQQKVLFVLVLGGG